MSAERPPALSASRSHVDPQSPRLVWAEERDDLTDSVAVALGAGGRNVLLVTARGTGGQPGPVQHVINEDLGSQLPSVADGHSALVLILSPTAQAPALDLDADRAGSEIRHALGSVLRGAQAFARHRRDHGGGGSIVVVGTVDAVHAAPGRLVAATIGGGLLGLTRALALELGSLDIRVNAVLMGPTSKPGAPAPDLEIERRTLLRAPMHRLGTLDEVARAVEFVADERAPFLTGASLRVDGGWSVLGSATDWSKPTEPMPWTS